MLLLLLMSCSIQSIEEIALKIVDKLKEDYKSDIRFCVDDMPMWNGNYLIKLHY